MYIAYVRGLILDVCILHETNRVYRVKDKEYETLKKVTVEDGVSTIVNVEYEKVEK